MSQDDYTVPLPKHCTLCGAKMRVASDPSVDEFSSKDGKPSRIRYYYKCERIVNRNILRRLRYFFTVHDELIVKESIKPGAIPTPGTKRGPIVKQRIILRRYG